MGMIARAQVLTLKWQLAKRIPKHGSHLIWIGKEK